MTYSLRVLVQAAIDRADPKGAMRTGHESVSVSQLRGMLRDTADEIREAKAAAWDEGYESCQAALTTLPHNPYQEVK